MKIMAYYCLYSRVGSFLCKFHKIFKYFKWININISCNYILLINQCILDVLCKINRENNDTVLFLLKYQLSIILLCLSEFWDCAGRGKLGTWKHQTDDIIKGIWMKVFYCKRFEINKTPQIRVFRVFIVKIFWHQMVHCVKKIYIHKYIHNIETEKCM